MWSYVIPLYRYGVTPKLTIVSSPNPATGPTPSWSSWMYPPGETPGATVGTPATAPSTGTPFFVAFNGFTTVAPFAATIGTFTLEVVVKSAVVSAKVWFSAVTVHVLSFRIVTDAGSQVWVSEMLPCC